MSSRQKYIEDVCKSNLQTSSQIPDVRLIVRSLFRISGLPS